MKEQAAIGIIDSGIGGFTVAKAVQSLLPQENIVYLGDGANAPYGNRSQPQLVALAQYMVEFMNQQEVKLLLVACNTISCLASHYGEHIASPVLYVVKSGATGIAHSSYEHIGVISTVFTHKQGMYAQHIRELAPQKKVSSAGSTHLVRLIEENRGDKLSREAIATELSQVISPLTAQGAEVLVLGCTHYPLVQDIYQEVFPQLPCSDPAIEMARQAKDLLTQENLLNPQGGYLRVYTTGDPALQPPHLQRAHLQASEVLHHPPLLL